MKRLFTAFALSLVMAISFVPSLSLALTGDGLTATEAADAPTTLTAQTVKTPKITVKNASTGTIAVKVGKTYKLGAKTTAGKLSFKSSKKKVAKVSSKGIVKARKSGKATITITAKNGSKKATKKITVKVLSAKKYKAVKKIKVKASAKTLRVGKTGKVKVSFTPSKASNKNVVYKSSNSKVLSVSASGKVKAKKAGKAKITVTSCANSKAKASVTIKVKANPTYQPLNSTKWNSRMRLPTDSQIRGYSASNRSPYLVCWPEFPVTTGYYEYAVDFKADSQPGGTYLSIGCWWMDLSGLRSRYTNVFADEGYSPGGGYAGFQMHENGRKVAIMSIWNIYVTDSSGTTYAIKAKRTYPSNPYIGADFDGEGSGVQTMVEYDWKAGRTYRALIQCGQTSAGNCELIFWVQDLTTHIWTKLVSYDLGYGTWFSSLGCFSENYLVDYAPEIRTVEWSNFRAHSRDTGNWVTAKSAIMERQFDSWTGSYNYGSDSNCFWAVATGVPYMCSAPANRTRYYVSNAEEGQPY